MKRLSIGTSFIGILAYCAISTLFFSCSGDIVQPEQPTGQTTGRTVRKELTLRVAPMLPAQGGETTRGTVEAPLNEDEARIHSLWVLQFGSTAGPSMLIKKSEVSGSEINSTTGVFSFDFEELADGGQIKVYLLANFPASALNGYTAGSTTLASFEAGNLSVTPLTEATLKTSGLPMLGAQSFAYATENPAPFVLKSPLAKVVFQYSAIGFAFSNVNLSADNLASAVPLNELAAGAAVQHPAGVTYTGSLTVVGDGTYSGDKKVCYLPENLSGQVASITQDKDRGGAAVPQEAACINMKSNDLSAPSYHFYMGDGTAKDFNLQRHHAYTFDIKLRGMNPVDKRVTAGSTANCYIVTKAGTYSFDATKAGNDSNVSGITKPTDLETATTAKVIWQTDGITSVVNTVKLDNGKVVFTTGSATEGNAVIGIFASNAVNAPCLWSWHIWRLSSAPADVACVKIPSPATASANFEMMDRNLGALGNTESSFTSIGLLYQWGRKDPFPSHGDWSAQEPRFIYGSYNKGGTTGSWNGDYSIQTVNYSVGGTEAWAVNYPTAFITKNSSGDWMIIRNDNLWGTPWIAAGSVGGYNGTQGTKSIYDPCPAGYRVPPQDTWSKGSNGGVSGFGMNVKSMLASSGLFWYPASEGRQGISGTLIFEATTLRVFSWSSSATSNSSASGMHILWYGDMNQQSDSDRADGYCVRCVKEQ